MFSQPERKSGQARDHILNVAEGLFARDGFSATSMRQIAEASEANVATIYYHCGDKEGLFLAIYQRVIERMALFVADTFADTQDFADAAVQLVDTIVDYFAQNPSVPRLLIRATLDDVPGFGETSASTFGPLFERVARELSERAEAGEIRPVHPVSFVVGAASVILNLSLDLTRGFEPLEDSRASAVDPDALDAAKAHARLFILGAVGLDPRVPETLGARTGKED